MEGLLAVHISWLLVSIITVLLDIISIILVIVTSPILKLFKILLVNLLVADLVASTAVVLNTGAGTVLLSNPVEDPSQELCRIIVFLFPLGISSRMGSLVAFSVIMFLVITRGVKKLKTYHVIVATMTVWFFAVVLTVDTLIPQVTGVRFVNNATCIPISDNGVVVLELRIVLRVIWNVLRGALLIVSSILPIVALCYIKKVTISRNSLCRKVLSRLTPFLLLTIAELYTFLSLLLTNILISLAQNHSITETETVYVCGFLLTASIVPTPILVLIFVTMVRKSTGNGCTVCLKQQTKSEDDEIPFYHRVLE